MRGLIFGTVLTIILLALSFGIKRYVVRSKKIKTRWIVFFIFLFAFLTAKIYFHQKYFELLFGDDKINIAYPFFWLIGFCGLLIIQFFILDLYNLIKKFIKRPSRSNNINKGRRDFFKSTAVLSVAATGSYFGEQNTKKAILKKTTIAHPKLPKEFSNLKIGLISDLHAGPIIGKDYVKDVCNRLMTEKPDIIALTGDIADGHVEDLKDVLGPVASLSAPLGVFFVTGNHEYYWNVEKWISFYKSAGITVLTNSNDHIKLNGKTLLIGGVNDYKSQRIYPAHTSDPFAAKKTSLKSDFSLVLAHRPKSCYEAAKAGFNLQLSGHTHGGQSFPYNLIVSLVQPYFKGLYWHKEMAIYVTAGAGHWGPPVRLGVPAEISLITLKPANFS